MAQDAVRLQATEGSAHGQGTLRRLAKQISRKAQENALKPNFKSPWAGGPCSALGLHWLAAWHCPVGFQQAELRWDAVDRAKAGLGSLLERLRPVGGKMDDCTTVVALVHDSPPSWG